MTLRLTYLLLSTLTFTLFFLYYGNNHTVIDGLIGLCFGVSLSLVIFGLEQAMKFCKLKTFILLILGIGIGYLIYDLSLLLIATLLSLFDYGISNFTLMILRLSVLLTSIYSSISLCSRFGNSLFSPFFHFFQKNEKKIIIDYSALEDHRLVELAFSGLLDNQLILFQGVIDYVEKNRELPKVRKASETLQKLFLLSQLKIEIKKIQEPIRGWEQMLKVASKLQAKILISEKEKVVPFEMEGVRLINLHTISRKPIMESGETMDIKVLRVGTEEDQGIGYLEDGTMVVVNGGKGYLGSVVQARVLSVKEAPTGRVMIFCNVVS